MKRNYTRYLTCLALWLLAHSLQAQYSFSVNERMRDDFVTIFDLSKNGYSYGHAIWMDRSRSDKKIKAKYFASGNVYQQYLAWKGNKDIILVSSGAYSSTYNTATGIPVGLCVDNGKIVNRAITNEMDGLVIVEAVGGVRVSDIEKRDLYLRSLGKKINPISDKYELLNWGVSENATIFQTHLLVYSNQLKCKPVSQTSNRGMLVLATNKQNEVMHILFEINSNVTLYNAASDILASLRNRSLDVVGIMNLDRGFYDILEVYNDYGRNVGYLSGPKSVATATNLLVYYYE